MPGARGLGFLSLDATSLLHAFFESEQVRTSQVEGIHEGHQVQLHACISSLTSPMRHLELLRATVSVAHAHTGTERPTQMMLSDPSCVPCFRVCFGFSLPRLAVQQALQSAVIVIKTCAPLVWAAGEAHTLTSARHMESPDHGSLDIGLLSNTTNSPQRRPWEISGDRERFQIKAFWFYHT